MKISIVTVCFNASTTISDAIDSVQRQDYPCVEHIIVDGDSTDKTQSVVISKANQNTVFLSEPDEGLYDAMNKGIARATGDIIGILNADDYLADPTVLTLIAQQFMDDPCLDAVLGDVAFLPNGLGIVRKYDSGRFRPDRIAWGWMPAHPGMYLKRSAYARVGNYSTNYRIASDFDFVVRAFGKVGLRYRHIPRIFVQMRPGGISTAGLHAKWTINREMLLACKKHGIKSSWFMILSKYFYKIIDHVKL